MKRYLVYFNPIEISEADAQELSSFDPTGERVDLEVKILKANCLTDVAFSKNKREPFPLINSIVEVDDDN